jgi:hypothetical protein
VRTDLSSDAILDACAPSLGADDAEIMGLLALVP